MKEQQQLKDRFIALMRIAPKSVAELSRDIGINETVFHNFWNMKTKIQLKTIMKIENFLEKKESAGSLD